MNEVLVTYFQFVEICENTIQEWYGPQHTHNVVRVVQI